MLKCARCVRIYGIGAELVEHRAPHILHMQKAFQQMNIQLPQVLDDITGVTGMAIVRAIVAGERDSVKLAQLRDYRCKSSEETIAKALTGTWKEEHIFVLKQSLALYDFYTQQVAVCDAQIEQQYAVMKPRWPLSMTRQSLRHTRANRKVKMRRRLMWRRPLFVSAELI